MSLWGNRFRTAFTMIEVVVAIAVVAISFIPLANLFHHGTEDTTDSISDVVADNYASDLMNFVRSISFIDLYKAKSSWPDNKPVVFANDAEIARFFRDSTLKKTSPIACGTGFSRQLSITYNKGEVDESFWVGLWHSLIDTLKDRQKVRSFIIKVVVSFKKASNRRDDKVILYSLIVE